MKIGLSNILKFLGVLAYKMGMFVPGKVKKKGVYRTDQT